MGSAAEGRAMRRGAYWAGVACILTAVAAVPSGMVVTSYVGGSAVLGSVEDGRYVVSPRHGRPDFEVSEAAWRTAYWAERLWPFSVLAPLFLGFFLTAYGTGSHPETPPPPPKELPPRVLWACAAAGVLKVLGTRLFWVVVGVPWATIVAAWALGCVSVAAVVWLYTRSVGERPTADSAAPPDRGVA